MKALMARLATILVTTVLALPTVGSAETNIFLSGRELSPGVTTNDTVFAVLFAGWTVDEDGWTPISESTGGHWMASLRRIGDAGFDSTVWIIGGFYTIQLPSGESVSGRFLKGDVTWPYDANEDLGCGDGIAVIDADVSLSFPWGRPWRPAGYITGCLDDQEWLEPSQELRLPPRIWATMTFYKKTF